MLRLTWMFCLFGVQFNAPSCLLLVQIQNGLFGKEKKLHKISKLNHVYFYVRMWCDIRTMHLITAIIGKLYDGYDQHIVKSMQSLTLSNRHYDECNYCYNEYRMIVIRITIFWAEIGDTMFFFLVANTQVITIHKHSKRRNKQNRNGILVSMYWKKKYSQIIILLCRRSMDVYI